MVEKTSVELYVDKLKNSKNIIFRGAPGTGKTYLAHQIAANIVSGGNITDYKELSKDQKEQIEFVQFHPSYDYTDFVEGLRPISNDDGTMGFVLKAGVFKKFVEKARKNLADSKKSVEVLERELKNDNSMEYFLSNLKLGVDEFNTITKTQFAIVDYNEKYIIVSTSNDFKVKKFPLRIEELRNMLNSENKFEAVKDVTNFFGKKHAKREYSYLLALNKVIKEMANPEFSDTVEQVKRKDFVFIIDEINRGEISKIFGELFFSIDPSYRGEDGAVSTQYANLHDNANEKLYIPENVYIIGTMNDIDRSVDTFDFAMRRRFRFVEIKANDNIGMLDSLDNNDEAIKRMTSLNDEIVKVEGLNANYQIGASYFLKLKDVKYDYSVLWSDYLEPLLQDYVQGMYNAMEIIEKLKAAYNLEDNKGDANDSAQI